MRKWLIALGAVLFASPIIAIPLFAFSVTLLLGGPQSAQSNVASAQPGAFAASAESLTMDPVLLARISAETGIPPRALLGVAIITPIAIQQTGCNITWWLLNAVGKVESGNGTTTVNGVQASIGDDWDVSPPIGGLLLDGNGFAAIFDGMGGFDRAQGPFQFITSSWGIYGQDGNGDGIKDPHNFLDAALAAAHHLCDSAQRAGAGTDLSIEANARAGLMGYNRSTEYGNEVWSTAMAYRAAGGDVLVTQQAKATIAGTTVADGITIASFPWSGPMIDGVEGLDPNFANRMSALAAETERETGGSTYVYSGFRSVEKQREIVADHDGVCGEWVACVNESTGTCGSFHCKGLAADTAWTSDAADAYFHDNMARFGLKQAMYWEHWHIEPIETRNGGYAT